jgi:hypothetical protein
MKNTVTADHFKDLGVQCHDEDAADVVWSYTPGAVGRVRRLSRTVTRCHHRYGW